MRAAGYTRAFSCPSRRFLSSKSVSSKTTLPVETIIGHFNEVNLESFRQKAFLPEKPLLISSADKSANIAPAKTLISLPAAGKWFGLRRIHGFASPCESEDQVGLSQTYLAPFGSTLLPYELIVDAAEEEPQSLHSLQRQAINAACPVLADHISHLLQTDPKSTFHHFSAPLSLFLQASNSRFTGQLYIAQAQIADLPKPLQEDLPTPRLVREAGRGDIYDANIWMGIPPTYTPLHKDPNPNLFVQLASRKVVRLLSPDIGRGVFYDVQQRIGSHSSSSFRGDEMMAGPERAALEEATWGHTAPKCFEVTVNPGDALFIPKGWWHSIKSIGTDITASVNWWFR